MRLDRTVLKQRHQPVVQNLDFAQRAVTVVNRDGTVIRRHGEGRFRKVIFDAAPPYRIVQNILLKRGQHCIAVFPERLKTGSFLRHIQFGQFHHQTEEIASLRTHGGEQGIAVHQGFPFDSRFP